MSDKPTTAQRNTTRRNRHRATVARGQPPCHWCGQEIDYQANWLNPLAFQIDHVIPLHHGGADDIENIVASHRRCNRDKGSKMPKPAGVTFVTDRNWS